MKTEEEAAVETKEPAPKASRHRIGHVTHRGRKVSYVCINESPTDNLEALGLLAEMVRKANTPQ